MQDYQWHVTHRGKYLTYSTKIHIMNKLQKNRGVAKLGIAHGSGP